jgi:hypothetical protein
MGASEAALGDPEKAGELILAGALKGTAFGAGFGGAIGGVSGLAGGVRQKLAERALTRLQSGDERTADVFRVMKAMGLSQKKAESMIGRKGESFLEDVHWLLMEAPVVQRGKGVFEPVLTPKVKSVEEAAERLRNAWEGAGKDIEDLGVYMRRRAKEYEEVDWQRRRASMGDDEPTPTGRSGVDEAPPVDREAPTRIRVDKEAPTKVRPGAVDKEAPTALHGKPQKPTQEPTMILGEGPPPAPPAPPVGGAAPGPHTRIRGGTPGKRSWGPEEAPPPPPPGPEPAGHADFGKPYFSREQIAAEVHEVLRREAPSVIAGEKAAGAWAELEAIVVRLRKGQGATGKRVRNYDFRRLQEIKQQIPTDEYAGRRVRDLISKKQEELVERTLGAKVLKSYRQSKRTYRAARDLSDEVGLGIELGSDYNILGRAGRRAGRHAANAAVWRMAYRGGLDPKAMAQMGVLGLPVFLAAEAAESAMRAWRPPLRVAYDRMRKLGTLGAMQQRMDGTHNELMKAVRTGLRGARTGLTYGGVLSNMTGYKDRNKALNEYRTRMQTYQQNPQRLADDVMASVVDVSEDAPQVAHHMANTIARATQLMTDSLPPQNTVSMLHSQHGKDVYSESVLARVDRVAGAITNPNLAIKRALAGVGTPEELEVLQKVYPQMMVAVHQMLAEEFSNLGRPPTYQEALRLRPFLGAAGHAMLEPLNVMQNQSIFMAQAGGEAQPTAMPKKPSRTASLHQTATQRLENPT